MCLGVYGSVPVPTEWPEQKVQILTEDASPKVKIEYRTLAGGTASQMIVRIARLEANEEAHAYVTFEVTRRTLLPPADRTIFKTPRTSGTKTRTS